MPNNLYSKQLVRRTEWSLTCVSEPKHHKKFLYKHLEFIYTRTVTLCGFYYSHANNQVINH